MAHTGLSVGHCWQVMDALSVRTVWWPVLQTQLSPAKGREYIQYYLHFPHSGQIHLPTEYFCDAQKCNSWHSACTENPRAFWRLIMTPSLDYPPVCLTVCLSVCGRLHTVSFSFAVNAHGRWPELIKNVSLALCMIDHWADGWWDPTKPVFKVDCTQDFHC